MDFNQATIVGRVTKNPELKQTKGGTNVCAFSVATNYVWSGKDGVKNEEVEFHNCVAYGRTAEIVAKYSMKGAMLLVQGRIKTSEWEGKDQVKRRTTEIIVDTVQLGPKPQGAAQRSTPADVAEQPAPIEEIPTINIDEEIKAEDLPF